MDFGPDKLDSQLLLDYGVLDASNPRVCRGLPPLASDPLIGDASWTLSENNYALLICCGVTARNHARTRSADHGLSRAARSSARRRCALGTAAADHILEP